MFHHFWGLKLKLGKDDGPTWSYWKVGGPIMIILKVQELKWIKSKVEVLNWLGTSSWGTSCANKKELNSWARNALWGLMKLKGEIFKVYQKICKM